MIGAVGIGVGVAVVTFFVAWSLGQRRVREVVAGARAEAAAAIGSARIEMVALRRAEETAAREQVLGLRAACDREVEKARRRLRDRDRALSKQEAAHEELVADLDSRQQELDGRHKRVRSLKDSAASRRRDAGAKRKAARARLEERVGEAAEEVKQRLAKHWLEETQAGAAQLVRSVEQSATDPQHDEHARRLMQIAVSRYRNHFLTERSISRLPLETGVAELLTESDGRVHAALQQVANIKLMLSDEGDHVRLEGLDGVGREVARRALRRLAKRSGAIEEARVDPEQWTTRIKSNLEREIQTLGRRAFSVLKIERSHDDIVDLVGRLNYRTSYTQNQWLHAVEASFLAGMIAEEMGLDRKLARKATLLHDIGKALTHEIDGSHAVIGADIARKLGEDEIIANAIGAHHADEPCNSVYAHLVAAADAMSGARPGARREMTEAFGNRVEDLERLASEYRGVEAAYAVHGGRELRIYVREGERSDLEVIEMSSEIAQRISEEMTFPGQIKVTVIRAYEAVATAS